MTFCDLYTIMVGEGGMPTDEFMQMIDVGMAMMWISGMRRRYRSAYEAARIVARTTASIMVKDLPSDFLAMPWDDEDIVKEHDSIEKEIADYKRAEPEMMAALMTQIYKKDGKKQ